MIIKIVIVDPDVNRIITTSYSHLEDTTLRLGMLPYLSLTIAHGMHLVVFPSLMGSVELKEGQTTR